MQDGPPAGARFADTLLVDKERAGPAPGGLRPVLLRWRGARLHAYPTFLYLGLLSGVLVGRAIAPGLGMEPDRFAMATVLLSVPALLGARLLFVVRHLPRYRREPARLWGAAEGGAAVYGGLPLSIAAALPLLSALGLPIGAFSDVAAIVILVGMTITKLGCLLYGCCAGRATGGRLALHLPDHRGVWARRVPSPLIEAAFSAWLVFGLAILWPRLAGHGSLFLVALAAYATGRYFLEGMRAFVDRIAGVSVNRAISVALLALSLTLLAIRALGSSSSP